MIIFFSNSLEFGAISGNITHSIADHLIKFVTGEDFIKPLSLCKCNIYKRNLKNFDRNQLKEDIYKIDGAKVIHENVNNINDAFNSFYRTLTEILDHHAPLIQINQKERILHVKPWVNKEIQYLMWKKDKNNNNQNMFKQKIIKQDLKCFYLFQLIFRLTSPSSHFQRKINNIFIQVKL